MSAGGWNELWDARAAPAPAGSLTARLMAAGGLDSGFAHVSEGAWHDFVARTQELLRLQPGDSVFEVGCGAGAFLYDMWRRGLSVAGIDRSPALIDLAAEVMPGASFEVRDASDLDVRERSDAVVSHGVFLYFPSHEYAAAVLERMIAKSRGAVAVLDVPDLERKVECEAARERAIGGADAYRLRYAGLEHRYYSREWLAERMRAAGLVEVATLDHDMAGYGNAPFRFHAVGFVDRSSAAANEA